MSDTPLTDAADDKRMSYNVRFERVRDLCRELEKKLAEALAAGERLHQGDPTTIEETK